MKKGTDQKDKLTALKRIEGQVRGIQRMVEERRYCVEILQATQAAIGALKTVEARILKDHLHACVKNAFEGGSRKGRMDKLNEIHELFKRA